MIPRNLHHIWFGDDDPPERLRICRETFLFLHPDWSIRYWRGVDLIYLPEFDNRRDLIQEHFRRIESICKYPNRQVAFKADIIRLCALYLFGGVYVDHDMYCLKPLDDLLDSDCILMQFRKGQVGEGIMGFEAGDERLPMVIDHVLKDSPRRICGLQLGWMSRQYGWSSFPPEYFCPHPRMNIEPQERYRQTHNTYMIHLWREHEYDFDLLREMSWKATNARIPQPV